MTKHEQQINQQHRINSLNAMLNQAEERLRSATSEAEIEMLTRMIERTAKRLMKLYDTEKYGLVRA